MLTFLNVGRMGRLANAMFSIAGTIGVATKIGQNYGFPLFINHDAKERFGSTEDIDVYKHFVNPLPLVPDGLQWNELSYFWGYRDLSYNQDLRQGNWNLNSHFQSDKYFSHCIDLIRHYFTMIDEPEPIESIALHMRFGDYDGNYHPLPDPEYYKAALEHLPKDMNISIFSDNLEAAFNLMENIIPGYTLEWDGVTDDYLTAFKQMKKHKHFICGNSSYSLMAAILADQPGKIVVCPKKWFGDHVQLETTDLYPQNSIVI